MSNLTKQEIVGMVARANAKTSRYRAAYISDAIGVAFKAMNDELDPREEVQTFLSVYTGKTWDTGYRYKDLLPDNHPLSENAVLNKEKALEWIEADPGLVEKGLVASASLDNFDSVYAKARLQVLSNIGSIDIATYRGLLNIELEDI
jgi:hypothetical protein